MIKKTWFALLIALFLVPSTLLAQGVAIGARVGTAGIGPEFALGLSPTVVLRAGIGMVPLEYTDDIDGQEYTLSLPSSFTTVGVDFYPGGAGVRLMGGVLFRTGNVEVETPVAVGDEFGGENATAIGTLSGELEQKSVAPFAGIGFGKHTAGGAGIFVDLAVAYAGTADINISAPGTGLSTQALENEANKIKDDIGDYIKLWPVINLGLKIPLG